MVNRMERMQMGALQPRAQQLSAAGRLNGVVANFWQRGKSGGGLTHEVVWIVGRCRRRSATTCQEASCQQDAHISPAAAVKQAASENQQQHSASRRHVSTAGCIILQAGNGEGWLQSFWPGNVLLCVSTCGQALGSKDKHEQSSTHEHEDARKPKTVLTNKHRNWTTTLMRLSLDEVQARQAPSTPDGAVALQSKVAIYMFVSLLRTVQTIQRLHKLH